MTTQPRLMRLATLPVFDRGQGIQTLVFSNKEIGATVTSGITRFPPGTGIPLHYHNCDEQTTVLEGDAEAEIAGQKHPMRAWDTVFIPEGTHHRFVNAGSSTMTILWVYNVADVTRTFAETGETVPHLSARDLATAKPRD